MAENAQKTETIGFLARKLTAEGITDIGEIATRIQALKDRQNDEGIWSWDRYTESGSDSSANVITEASQEKNACILWSLNHYLGLNRNPRVIQKTMERVRTFGTGCGTSAVSGGMNSLHKEIELRVANLLGKEKVILFPTGFTANLGALAAFGSKKDLILMDHESHASIIAGVRLSGKEWSAFKHNDVEALEQKLAKAQGAHDNIFVVVESAYSMSGDLCPLREIVALKQKYRFYLYVDEAHTFGLYGEKGAGYCVEQGVVDQVDFIMSTLSKATASIGGFIATQKRFCSYLQVSSAPYLFQACLTPADAGAVLACMDELEEDPSLIRTLHEKNKYFRKHLRDLGFNLGESASPIVPLYIPDLETLYAFGRDLYDEHIFSVMVTYPAVKMNAGRIRLIVNASHSYAQLDETLRVLELLARKYGLIT